MSTMDAMGNPGAIRAFCEADLDEVMQLWLDSNREAHGFIQASYWEENFASVRTILPQAEVYVWEEGKNREIRGFIGIDGSYIAGIFVQSQARSRGIGRQLLQYVKKRKQRLTLHVYPKNERAVQFYQREGFYICSQGVDEHTGEREYEMAWERRDA